MKNKTRILQGFVLLLVLCLGIVGGVKMLEPVNGAVELTLTQVGVEKNITSEQSSTDPRYRNWSTAKLVSVNSSNNTVTIELRAYASVSNAINYFIGFSDVVCDGNKVGTFDPTVSGSGIYASGTVQMADGTVMTDGQRRQVAVTSAIAPDARYQWTNGTMYLKSVITIGPGRHYITTPFNSKKLCNATVIAETEGAFYINIPEYKITTQATNGTITPSTEHIPTGATKTVSYSPNAGYKLSSVKVDGTDKTTANPSSVTFSNINANHTVTVVYVPIPGESKSLSTTKQYSYSLPSEFTFTKTDSSTGKTVAGAVFKVEYKYSTDSAWQSLGNKTTDANGKITATATKTGNFSISSGTYYYYTNYSTLVSTEKTKADQNIATGTYFKTQTEAQNKVNAVLSSNLTTKQNELKAVTVQWRVTEVTAPTGYKANTTTVTTSAKSVGSVSTSGTTVTGTKVSNTATMANTPIEATYGSTSDTATYTYALPAKLSVTKKNSATKDLLANVKFKIEYKYSTDTNWTEHAIMTTDSNGNITTSVSDTGSFTISTDTFNYYTNYSILAGTEKTKADENIATGKWFKTKAEADSHIAGLMSQKYNAKKEELENKTIQWRVTEQEVPTGIVLDSTPKTTTASKMGTLTLNNKALSSATNSTTLNVANDEVAAVPEAVSKSQKYTYELPTNLTLTKSDADTGEVLDGAKYLIEYKYSTDADWKSLGEKTTDANGKIVVDASKLGNYTIDTGTFYWYSNYNVLTGSQKATADANIANGTHFKTKEEATNHVNTRFDTLYANKLAELESTTIQWRATEVEAPSGYNLDSQTKESSVGTYTDLVKEGTNFSRESIALTLNPTDIPTGGLFEQTNKEETFDFNLPSELKLVKQDSETGEPIKDAKFNVSYKYSTEEGWTSVGEKATDDGGIFTADAENTGSFNIDTGIYYYYTNYSILRSTAKKKADANIATGKYFATKAEADAKVLEVFNQMLADEQEKLSKITVEWKVQETDAPAGYLIDTEVKHVSPKEVANTTVNGTQVTGNTIKSEIIVKDTPILIKKLDSNNEQVVGAVLQIFDNDDTRMCEFTSEETAYKPHGLIVGQTYKLHEVRAPKGYLRAKDVEFTAKNQDTTQEVIMTDPSVKIVIKDPNGDGFGGSSITIKDEDGNIIIEDIMDTDTYEPEGLDVGKTYIIEILPPEGKDRIPPITITFEPEDTVVEIIVPTFRVDKVNKEGNRVTGAELALMDSETGDMIEQWVSGQRIIVLTEEQQTELFENEKLEFERDEANYSITKRVHVNEETMEYEDSYNLVITKDSKISYHDIDKDGFETTHILQNVKTGGKYIIRELSAPKGYAKINDVEINIPEDTTINSSFAVLDPKIDVRLFNEDKEFILGATLTVYDEEGNVIDTWQTEDKNHAITGLEVGKTYTIVEEYTPNGYVRMRTYTFTVDSDETITLYNTIVKIDKVTPQRDRVFNAVLRISDTDGNVIDEWTTGRQIYDLKDVDIDSLKEGESLELDANNILVNKSMTEADIAIDASIEALLNEMLEFEPQEPTEEEITLYDIDETLSEEEKILARTEGFVRGNVQTLLEQSSLSVDGRINFTDVLTDDMKMLTKDSDSEAVAIAKKLVKEHVQQLYAELEQCINVIDYDGLTITKQKDCYILTLYHENEVEYFDVDEYGHELWHRVSGLKDGEIYVLSEVQAPFGYTFAPNIEFRIDKCDQNVSVVMLDMLKLLPRTSVLTNIGIFGGTGLLLGGTYLGMRKFKHRKK